MNTTKKMLLAAACAAGLVTTSNAQTFVEQNGLVVMEAESVNLPNGWAFRRASSIPSGDPDKVRGFTGNGFIEWTGAVQTGLQIPNNQAVGVITYQFRINQAGTYRMRWRTKQRDNGQRDDLGNDTFFRFATGSNPSGAENLGTFTKTLVSRAFDNWKFETRAEPRKINGDPVFIQDDIRRFFPAGVHRIQLAARSPGHVIDRIIIHRSNVPFNANQFRTAAESRRETTNNSGVPRVGQRVAFRGNNNRFVSSENGTRDMRCNRSSVGAYERFTIVDAGSGRVGIRGNNNRFVSSRNGDRDMNCVERRVLSQERFRFESLPNNRIAIRSSQNEYVSSENGNRDMRANRPRVGNWERFTWSVR